MQPGGQRAARPRALRCNPLRPPGARKAPSAPWPLKGGTRRAGLKFPAGIAQAMLTAEEKRRFLRALEEDLEFRYAVAGLLGLGEVLKRLDALAEEQAKTWRAIEELSKELARVWQEIERLREEVTRIWQNIERLWQEVKALREEQAKLAQAQVRIHTLLERLQRGVEAMEVRLERVERTLDKLTLDIEEEAREVVAHRLRQMGLQVRLERLELPGVEIDLYGASSDVCVIGEATVRLGKGGARELKRKVESLARLRPDLLRPRVILVAYTSLATAEALEEAEREGVWVLKATGDLTPPPPL